MKIGILTFHRAENFGAALQCLALQKALKDLGCEAEVLDYRNRAIEAVYSLWSSFYLFKRRNKLFSLWLLVQKWITIPVAIAKKRKYQDFWCRYLNFSSSFEDSQELPMGFDALVCGSDQVWNLNITNGFDPAYFLGFKNTRNTIKFSYAASSESGVLFRLGQHSKEVSHALSQFRGVSVRERELAGYLQPMCSTQIEVVADPTFLQQRSFYEQIQIIPKLQNYVLVYHLVDSVVAKDFAEQIANSHGLAVVEIHAGIKLRGYGNRHLQDLGPRELLGYIGCAEFVVTTSFHGLAMSLIYNKEVYVPDVAPNGRQKSLLNDVGLGNRMIQNGAVYRPGYRIDYGDVNEKLMDMRINGIQFLNRMTVAS